MSTNEVPRYEWRYMPQSNWMDEADGSLRDSILRYELALVLAYAHEESVVVRMYNPEPDKNPEAQRLLNTSLVNETLKRAFATPGGAMHAMAAHVLFEHQVRTAPAPREQLLLEAAPPRFDNKLIEDILAPGLGWLVWRWQFEALATTAGCNEQHARELAAAWSAHYPRARALLGALAIDKVNLLSIVDAASRWNASTGTLHPIAPLLALRTFFGSRSATAPPTRRSTMTSSTLEERNDKESPEDLLNWFLEEFGAAWNAYTAQSLQEWPDVGLGPEWTRKMVGTWDAHGILANVLESMATRLDVQCSNAASQIRFEDNKLDLTLVGGKQILGDRGWGYPSRFHVIVEHERGDHPEEELWKLLFWMSRLKVIVMYDWAEKYWEKKDESKWLAEKKGLFSTMVRNFCAHPEGKAMFDSSRCLIVVGNRKDSESGIAQWRFFKLNEDGLTPLAGNPNNDKRTFKAQGFP